jgi:uncharacterized protein YebE (UPF0316 family)
MHFITDLPIWALALLIFCLRVGDVSIGTMRTIAVVNGRVKLSVLLGFFEVLIWILAIGSVIQRIAEHPLLPIAYAGGFAAGNAAGIFLERRLALGDCALRIVTSSGVAVAEAAGKFGRVVASFRAHPPELQQTLIFVVLERRNLPAVLSRARDLDKNVFWVVERFAETSRLSPLPRPSGWRAVAKMK